MVFTPAQMNAAYQLGVVGEGLVGDQEGFCEVVPGPDGRYFVGIGVVEGAIIPAMAIAHLEAKGFTINRHDVMAGGRGFTAEVVATERVPDIRNVVGE